MIPTRSRPRHTRLSGSSGSRGKTWLSVSCKIKGLLNTEPKKRFVAGYHKGTDPATLFSNERRDSFSGKEGEAASNLVNYLQFKL